MNTKQFLLVSALCALTSAHGFLRSITGANGAVMPGLSVVDGTPRDCSTPGCGAEQDTSVIRDTNNNPLGKTPGFGQVSADKIVSTFMGGATGASAAVSNSTSDNSTLATGAATNTTAADNTNTDNNSQADTTNNKKGGLAKLKGLLGILGKRKLGGGNQGNNLETIVGDTAGKGATSGLPTAADDGTINLTYHQVNGDGAGPVTAEIDPSSGGVDPSAFQPAEVTQQIPGVAGLSLNKASDLPLSVKMPAGMTCQGTVAGVQNVCIVRVKNPALAGPFGGSAAFTQSNTAQKRAIAYRMKKRMEFRA